MAFAPGTQIGKYVLRRKLGAGGYALVFAAHDPSLDREVALKVLKPEHASSEAVVRRFLQEARAAVRIIHPGIVTVFECGEISSRKRAEDFTAYIAMELLEGETLSDRIERCGRLRPAVVIEIGRQLAAALQAAHRAGIIHRDLKPGNVFLIEDSLVAGGERAKVLDFGLAKLGRTLAVPGMQTGSLTVFGTWRYMSPEQCRSAGEIDHRTDIYALGVMLFEMLAGRPPFDGHALELIAQHLTFPPPSLLALAPDVPVELAALIDQLLEKQPDARPASMEAVEWALEAIADAEGLAPVRPSAILGPLPRPPTVAPRPPEDMATTAPRIPGGSRASRRRRHRVYAAASLLLIASALGMFLGLRKPGIAPVPDMLAQAEENPRQVVRPSDPVVDAAGAAAGPADGAEVPAAPGAELAGIAKAFEESTDAAVEPAGGRAKPAGGRAEPAGGRAKPAGGRAKPAAARGKAGASTAASFGFLALAAKPACEISIDGRATGARTPLRELKLLAGKHRIRLVNDEHAIQDSFVVVIGAGVTERVTKDYSGQIKRGERKERDELDGTIDPFATGGR